ncbi:MAG: zinc ABC transporter substrate-binding protein [Infirmifilum sp.]
MNRRFLTATLLFVSITLIFAFYIYNQSRQHIESAKGLNIIVTFYSLKPDIEMLTCKGDYVYSVTPSGVDPHEYQLSPSDISKLKEADIIISTAHTPFETQIRDLVSKGEIKALLLEIPNIPGIKIKQNPATGQPNYHWPIYDPENYKTYIDYVEQKLEKLRPDCAAEYKNHAKAILDNVTQIQTQTVRLTLCAVATSPPAQYAVEWTGLQVKYLLIKEEGVPATPQDLTVIENSLKSGECRLILIVGATSTPIAQKALELSSKYNVPYLQIPDPISPDSTLSKISAVSNLLKNFKK